MDESKEEFEAKVSAAMHTRLSDFKEQADSLTLEGVRRVLEKDLGLEAFALDAHKKIVKKWMEKYFYGSGESDISRGSGGNMEGAVKSEAGKEKKKPGNERHSDLEEGNNGVDVLSSDEKFAVNNDSETTQDDRISEAKIKKALNNRVMYFRENSENMSMSGVRRTLEEDLKLAKNSLDAYKAFIKDQLDVVLSAEDEELVNGAKMGKGKKSISAKGKATVTKMNKRKKDVSESSEELSGSEAGSASEDSEEGNMAARKKSSRDLKEKTKPSKRQKISAKGSKIASPGKKKPAESKESSGTDNEVNTSDDNRLSSSADESSKKRREKPPPVYGKRVEHLKSIIKSCGMSVPPSIYKKAKDAPESKREAALIKELQGILEREGLSTNPSEKEIKALKKKKERAKELEGIDMGNIVSSSRRRTASSYIPPKPQIPTESEEDEDDESEDENSDEDSDNGVSIESSGEDAEGSD